MMRKIKSPETLNLTHIYVHTPFPATTLYLIASVIKHLMVLPTHQHRGIGAALLKTILEESDAAVLPTILISSAEGVKLYRTLGFEEKATWRIDNGAWSEKIAKRLDEGGREDVDGLVERYRGVDEVEMYVVRSPALW